MKTFFISIIITSCIGISACTPPKYRVYQAHTHEERINPSVTDILHDDFDVMKRMLMILDKASYCLDHDKPVSKETFQDIIAVISGFSDKHHQEKADKVLFPALKIKNDGEKKDFLGRLLREHVSARDEIRNLSGALNGIYQGKKAKKKITKITRAYIKHMEKHIEMEEKILFPWINKVLTPDEQAMFVKRFETMEKEHLEAGIHEKYSAMIERIEQQLELCSESE